MSRRSPDQLMYDETLYEWSRAASKRRVGCSSREGYSGCGSIDYRAAADVLVGVRTSDQRTEYVKHSRLPTIRLTADKPKPAYRRNGFSLYKFKSIDRFPVTVTYLELPSQDNCIPELPH